MGAPQTAFLFFVAESESTTALDTGCMPGADDKPDETSDDGQTVQVGQDYTARLGRVQFRPGTEVRRFLEVPAGATWAEMTLKAGNHDTPRYSTQLFYLPYRSQ